MKDTKKNLVEQTSKARQRAAKKAGDYYYSHGYIYSFPQTLEEAYGNASTAKWRAYTYCRELCADLNGFDFIIAGHNCMTFSVLFKFVDKETGALCYAYITRDYDSYCYA